MRTFPQKPPKIAIVDEDVLSSIGMTDILEIIMPGCSIRSFQSFEELMRTEEKDFVHYFVSSAIFLKNADFFTAGNAHAIILTHGEIISLPSGVRSLNICQTESGLMHDILIMRGSHHHEDENLHAMSSLLTKREGEVLALIVRGKLNKEIADLLNISITTVISHRKNIMDKLGIHSVSGLTVYAILNGLVHVSDIQNPH